MDEDQVISTFIRELSKLYGYDESFQFRGALRSSHMMEAKSFLHARDFLNFAIEDAASLDKDRSRVNCLGNCKEQLTLKLITL